MMTERTALPTRRTNATASADWQGHKFSVTVGFDLTGQPREVFADMAKAGSAMQAILSDACIIISIALQHGLTVDALCKSLGQEPDWSGTPRPSSPIGALLAVLTAATKGTTT